MKRQNVTEKLCLLATNQWNQNSKNTAFTSELHLPAFFGLISSSSFLVLKGLTFATLNRVRLSISNKPAHKPVVDSITRAMKIIQRLGNILDFFLLLHFSSFGWWWGGGGGGSRRAANNQMNTCHNAKVPPPLPAQMIRRAYMCVCGFFFIRLRCVGVWVWGGAGIGGNAGVLVYVRVCM